MIVKRVNATLKLHVACLNFACSSTTCSETYLTLSRTADIAEAANLTMSLPIKGCVNVYFIFQTGLWLQLKIYRTST